MAALRCVTPFCPWRVVLLMTVCALVVAVVHAQTATADISGAWRLDDQNSDSADTLTTLLRAEARREQPAALPATAHAASPSTDNNGAGRHGSGMGRGGMGGGHGHHHSDSGASSKKPGTDEDPLAHAQFALPPLLQMDSVLLVQEGAKSVQIQLDNGEQLDVRLDGQARQSLHGDAMVQGRANASGVRITILYADGRQLQQDWIRSPDGRQLSIHGAWKLPSMQQPVQFRRNYLAVG
ncbi:MAG: hypothetical protein ABI178_08145 [Rhodanobacter sp.]